MLEEKKTPKKWGKWLALTLLIIAAGYIIGDGWFTNKIEPQTVVAVYEPGGVRVLVNRTPKPTRMWKWPRILGTSIGVTEEPIKNEAKPVRGKFAMYTTDEVTGKAEDKEYVQAYVVDVEIKVKDWQKFFEEINLDEINEERRKAGPFARLMKDRFEVVAYQIESIIRGGKTTDRFGEPLRTKEGYPAMNLGDRINYAYSQLINRRNFLIALLDRYHFKTNEKIKEYLKEEVPWYWFAGPDMFELLAQRYKDIQESIFSPYIEDITLEASRQRFIFGEDRFEVYREVYRAYQYERFLTRKKERLEEIEIQRKAYGKEEAQKLLEWQEKKLKLEEARWERIREEELIPFFKYYSSSDTELALDIRRITAEENQALWEAAIEEVLGGEDITRLSSFIIHKMEKGDTLAKLVEKYNVSWELVFNEYTRGIIRENLELGEEEKKFDKLLTQGTETGDWRAAYELVKDIPLKIEESVLIERRKKFTPQWFEEKEEYRKKREEIVKKYIYRWIEKFAPEVIEEYIPVSPWMDYLERTYGVKIGKIKLHIEKDSMFTRGGEPKDEYYDLYYSKYVSRAKD
ncbi:MAG: hypothetical protein U9O41_10505 [Candidatus Aerophobetes bacterium]|nr:hypothetical protein [Candidatus Aerophobetes bacterium]